MIDTPIVALTVTSHQKQCLFIFIPKYEQPLYQNTLLIPEETISIYHSEALCTGTPTFAGVSWLLIG